MCTISPHVMIQATLLQGSCWGPGLHHRAPPTRLHQAYRRIQVSIQEPSKHPAQGGKSPDSLWNTETIKNIYKFTKRPAAITITRSWFIGSQHCLDFLTRWHVVVNTLMVVAVKAAVWVPWVGTDHSCATVIRSSISWSLCCMPAMNTRTLGYWEVSCNSAVALKTWRV